MEQTESDREACEPLLRSCRNILRGYNAGAVQGDEVHYSLMVTLVHAADDDARFGTRLRDCWGMCVALFPAELMRAFNEWLEREVAAVDYMPPPNAFMADTRDAAAVEARRRELRPHFVALHQLVRH